MMPSLPSAPAPPTPPPGGGTGGPAPLATRAQRTCPETTAVSEIGPSERAAALAELRARLAAQALIDRDPAQIERIVPDERVPGLTANSGSD
jgi:hypothetical protein